MISQQVQTDIIRKEKQSSESNAEKVSPKEKMLKNEIKQLNMQIKNIEEKNEQITKMMNSQSEDY